MPQKTLNGEEKRPKIELAEKIKSAVREWREEGYKGATGTTKRLLEYWFYEDHIVDEKPFEFWNCQKEAIEALIYVYEVSKLHRLSDLKRSFNVSLPNIEDLWPKYCFKMATGSGKTFVMELAMVWQYFNKLYESNGKYSSHYLIITPNIIVFDRLKESFQNAREIKKYPFIPPEWRDDFDLQPVLRGEERTSKYSEGILFLTNIQQLYPREDKFGNPVDKYFGPKPKKEDDPLATWEFWFTSLTEYEDLMIINDEAHHAHTDDLKWNQTIGLINDTLHEKYGNSLLMQLDFTATPKDPKGRYFPHIIYDYPLAFAIQDKHVKNVHIGLLENVPEPPTKDFVLKHKAQIDAGVEKLKWFKSKLSSSGKKPVMFVVADCNTHADDVGKYLEKYFPNKVLVIHTDTKGNITKKDLPYLREAARDIDTNQYEIIVSVMMLKEGWDVKNVVIIVPLRPAKAPTLPEQILGRGLRRMEPFNDNWEETLVVVDHPRFRELWDAEIRKGELYAKIEPIKIKPEVHSIKVDESKLEYDFEIPIVEGGITSRVPEISKLDIEKLPSRVFKLSEIKPPKVMWKEKELLTKRIVEEKELAFSYVDTFDEYLSYITKAIIAKSKIPSYFFSELVPKVKEYISKFLFEDTFDINNREEIKKLNLLKIRRTIVESFNKEILKLSTKEEDTYVINQYKLSSTPVLHTSKSEDMLYEPNKCIFNILPADSHFEIEFMRYLDSQHEVLAFTKVLRYGIPLRIRYYDYHGYLRYYIPDFIVKAENCFYLIETKGEEDINVRYKDKAATEWCKSATKGTGFPWKYVKIMAKDFGENSMLNLSQLIRNVGYSQFTLDEIH